MALVEYELTKHVASITLNRPEAMNALSSGLLAELGTVFAEFRSNPEARVAVIAGAGGKAFSTGADLKEMSRRAAGDGHSARSNGFAQLLERGSSDLFDGPGRWKPLVAAIDGYCLAGGLELALACDIRVCSPTSRFGLTEVARGIIPGGGGTQRLTRAVPLAVALDLLMTARHMDPDEALRYGLVNRVVPSEEVFSAAFETASAIAAHAPLAVQATKEAALRGMSLGLDDALRLEGFLLQMVVATEDAVEGPLAFAEKRVPQYVGR